MEKWIKISSLEEMASIQVALILCQNNCFKEVALCLEKPASDFQFKKYGAFIRKPSTDGFRYSSFKFSQDKINLCRKNWYDAVDQQCNELIEKLKWRINDYIKPKIHVWMNRIALEYLYFFRRQETIFGVSRYFWMNFLTRDDWTELCRLNEQKIAKRLLNDEGLTLLQRYRYACVYCLIENIPELRDKLTKEEKQSMSMERVRWLCSWDHLIHVWTFNWDGDQDRVMKPDLLADVAKQLAAYGNLAILVPFWRKLGKSQQKNMVTDLAMKSLGRWQDCQRQFNKGWVIKLVPTDSELEYLKFLHSLNLPYYHSEIMYFFLSEMNKDEQLAFFERSFLTDCFDLECFLNWPLQDYFLETINKLWGIIPLNRYKKCLSTLTSKYSGNYYYYCGRDFLNAYNIKLANTNEDCYYDFRSLLEDLWRITPDNYKQFVLSSAHLIDDIPEFCVLFYRLLSKYPFGKKDEKLFKLFFSHLHKKERIDLMNARNFKRTCSVVIKSKRWSFLNWLLKECLSEDEDIPSFKKQLVKSCLCYNVLFDSHMDIIEDLIDWCCELDSAEELFNEKLNSGKNYLKAFKCLLCIGEFAMVDGIINVCLVSDTMKEQFKLHLVNFTCNILVRGFKWEKMDDILSWCFDTKLEINDYKKDLFSNVGIHTHFTLLFQTRQLDDVKYFYKWFCLSPEEIENVKVETMFALETIEYIKGWLYGDSEHEIFIPLYWCSTNEEIVLVLREKIEKSLKQDSDKESENAKKRLDYLANRIFYLLRNEVEAEAILKSWFWIDQSEKRSVEVEGDSSCQIKKKISL